MVTEPYDDRNRALGLVAPRRPPERLPKRPSQEATRDPGSPQEAPRRPQETPTRGPRQRKPQETPPRNPRPIDHGLT